MIARLKANAARIGASFIRAFTATLALGNIVNIHDTRGVTTLIASAAIAGGAAALRALEAALNLSPSASTDPGK